VARGAALYVISHKSRFAAAAPDGPDLRAAAVAWLEARGIAGAGAPIPSENVFFEGTRKEKIARIAALELTHFVDDLNEVLVDPSFPRATRGILFEEDWAVVHRAVLG
jgi:hypothetical protein